ncbi:YkgJ family cysteine cluster protein [Rhodoplanes sp. TEM]|uniref:YkgJ family cysteine cluster protein n=1 Tax=Rhodoplanes tepidamans TaxID=200616 RepID=A0ABT5JBX4_RHOTP|nr:MULTISPECIES: YkgJ family cysteine cluster protein [Rhodoplanes]MDC7787186.1 YkgJ family cysteine cluster protein [Rhodoplanes tepidamans]MDC7984250.1 YkgJ family cysteine cluster protein [Rhodoplanes sp. TEM]MDQ0356047.1 Fe-S-cluster containining protein [Rhodoplanes tepidamans]
MIDPNDDGPAHRPEWSCQACGACCATSAEWPRFSLETEADLARIPAAHVDDGAGRMRCEGDRCTALAGEVGKATACSVYAVRPLVCRECEPGDPECLIARARWGLPTAVDTRGAIG